MRSSQSLGATAVGALWLPDEAFEAAANALFEFTSTRSWPGDPIYPPLTEIRAVSRHVAVAVATELVRVGAAPPHTDDEIERLVVSGMWTPEYLPYRQLTTDNLQLTTRK
jgi:malate dehydrogenase (oxaloacetate-decarboxylating)